MSQIIGLYGESGSGKTSLCKEISEKLSLEGRFVSGFISPAVFKGDVKVGIETLLFPGCEHKTLARLAKAESQLVVGKWELFPETLAWAETALLNQETTDVLVIDELGPLEVTQNKGWARALDILDAGKFRLAIITFRPDFVRFFNARYPGIIQMQLGPQKAPKPLPVLLDFIHSLPD